MCLTISKRERGAHVGMPPCSSEHGPFDNKSYMAALQAAGCGYCDLQVASTDVRGNSNTRLQALRLWLVESSTWVLQSMPAQNLNVQSMEHPGAHVIGGPRCCLGCNLWYTWVASASTPLACNAYLAKPFPAVLMHLRRSLGLRAACAD